MQRLLISAVAIGALAVSSQAQCFEQNFGVLAPLSGATAGFGDDVAFDEQPLGFPITFGANVYTHTHKCRNAQEHAWIIRPAANSVLRFKRT